MLRIASRAGVAVTAVVAVAVSVGGWLASGAVALAAAADRTAEEIVQEIDAVEIPTLDQEQARDREAVQAYFEKRQEATARRAELIKELYEVDPKHDRIAALMAERWSSLATNPLQAQEAAQEAEAVLAETDNPKLKAEAAFVQVRASMMRDRGRGNPEDALAAMETFLQHAPGDERGAQLLYMLANSAQDPDLGAKLEERLIAEFPDSRYATMIQGQRRRREGVGQPFELAFTDAIRGEQITMADLRGKVVVIDFWATWCGPCIAEMPKLKSLYGQYRDQGVEFIGVSLDVPEEDGGLDRLKTFVQENDIPWPQYYQGQGWNSAFSSAWGINAIPAIFVVAPDGTLYSTEARGKLEQMIPELLEKAKPEAGAEGE